MIWQLFSRGAAEGSDVVELEDFVRAVRSGQCDVIDVREPHEYGSGHVPGAINMPLSTFDPAALPNGGKPVVLICQAGGRSRTALNKARAAGRRDVAHYAGGTAGWRAAGGEVER